MLHPPPLGGRPDHEHYVGNSPPRGNLSPVTPNAANITRQIHGLMPHVDQFTYTHFAPTVSVAVSAHAEPSQQLVVHSAPAMSAAPMPAAAMPTSVIQDNTVKDN